MAGEFEHTERVGDLLVAPLITGDDGDAEHINIRGLQDEQKGLLVGGSRAAGVLIEDDFARGLGVGERDDQAEKQNGDKRCTTKHAIAISESKKDYVNRIRGEVKVANP
jgi:hypothetical protein